MGKPDMTRSTVFTTNRSQAWLPKSVALPPGVRQVEAIKVGRSGLISPADQSWGRYSMAQGFRMTSWLSPPSPLWESATSF